MKTQNKVQLIGYIGNEPEMKMLGDGIKMARFRVATDHRSKSVEGEWLQHTTWHDVIAWNAIAQIAVEKFSKGSHILVEGFIVYRTFEDVSGQTRYFTQIHAQHFLNLDR